VDEDDDMLVLGNGCGLWWLLFSIVKMLLTNPKSQAINRPLVPLRIFSDKPNLYLFKQNMGQIACLGGVLCGRVAPIILIGLLILLVCRNNVNV
jgi:hypothetical protein